MKIKHLLLTVFVLGFIATSCSESKEDGVYANWRERNENFVDSIANVYDSKQDPTLKRVEDTRNRGFYVYYKVIKESTLPVEEKNKPFLTSIVNVYYRGLLIDEEVIGKLPVENRYLYKAYKNLPKFDGNFDNEDPDVDIDQVVGFTVNGLVSGFTEVLQHMNVGDRWEIYIPSRLGYGNNNNGAIPGYSTLIFDVTLQEIVKQ